MVAAAISRMPDPGSYGGQQGAEWAALPALRGNWDNTGL